MTPRLAGVAVPLSALRSRRDAGIGEIFDLAPFIDWAVAAGQRLVALLPLGELGPGEASPYSSLSTFAIDPLYVTPAEVPELAGVRAAEEPPIAETRRVDRERVRAWKEPLFDEAFERFGRLPDDCARRRAYAAFRGENRDWLEDYALFRALAEHEGWRWWLDWPVPLRKRNPRAIAAARERFGSRIERNAYLQFAAEEQWWRVREHARRHEVLLMGDLPFAPSVNSADVWGDQRLFDLSRTVGAPPDDFSDTGPRGGLPMIRWKRLRADGWAWFRLRFRRLSDLYDLYRIDHVVGLFRTYNFRADGAGRFDPQTMAAQRAQGREILEVALAESGAGSIVAEDLGMVPDFVRECMSELDVPGYKVLRWERAGGEFVDPRDYAECSIATTGTHDNDTLVAWWRELPRAERTALLRLLGETAEDEPPAELGTERRERLLARLY
ncbi:MAG: 4-alpha-glucanotransferase, partial [Candidatus Binatia bacterium]